MYWGGHKVNIEVLKGIIIMMSMFPDHKGIKSRISTSRSWWYLSSGYTVSSSGPLGLWDRCCASLGLSLSSSFETASPCLPSSLPPPRGASSISSLWGRVRRFILLLSTELVPRANDSLEIGCEDLMFQVPRLSPGRPNSPHSSRPCKQVLEAAKSQSLLSPAESYSLDMKISSPQEWHGRPRQVRPGQRGSEHLFLCSSFFFFG